MCNTGSTACTPLMTLISTNCRLYLHSAIAVENILWLSWKSRLLLLRLQSLFFLLQSASPPLPLRSLCTCRCCCYLSDDHSGSLQTSDYHRRCHQRQQQQQPRQRQDLVKMVKSSPFGWIALFAYSRYLSQYRGGEEGDSVSIHSEFWVQSLLWSKLGKVVFYFLCPFDIFSCLLSLSFSLYPSIAAQSIVFRECGHILSLAFYSFLHFSIILAP